MDHGNQLNLDDERAFTDLIDRRPVMVGLDEGRWSARDINYFAGRWKSLRKMIPRFHTGPFQSNAGEPPNPYLLAVIREPMTHAERPIPVGVVSNSYRLAQHEEVIERCFDALRERNLDPEDLPCEIGLSPLGEWMNFRAYLPDQWSYRDAGNEHLALRLECFNSVDRSCRLVILLGWFRFVCSNGLVIGETKAELRDTHDARLDLQPIPQLIGDGLAYAEADIKRLQHWAKTGIEESTLKAWADNALSEAWGKKAACRVYHICLTGEDVKITKPFAPGKASEKPTEWLADVPGAAVPAANLYDVAQALAWVATHRSSVEERLQWQAQVGDLIDGLCPDRRHVTRIAPPTKR